MSSMSSAPAMSTVPLYGLVLAGGRSRRMQQDKAALPYAGRAQLARAMDLLSGRVARRFVSARPDQRDDPHRAAYPLIFDLQPDLGPIGGIQAALHAHPEVAWLILACDLPFLDPVTLDHLIANRTPARLATAYRSSHDGLPEPLCAIFEPAARAAIDAWIARGEHCPRALLSQVDARLLEPLDPHALDNINTREQYVQASETLHGRAPPGAARQLTVRYFALLREQAGRSQEALQTQARTPGELYQELRRVHGFTLGPESLRVAINEEFGDWRAPLAEGDTVAFLPPVAGG